MDYTKKFLKISALFLALLALVIVSAALTMKLVTWGRTVTVPDISGKDMATALVELKNSGLDIKVERQEHHPKVPAGYIITQSPLPGSSVKKGRDVLVIVSLGSEEVTVPELTGANVRRAMVQLKQVGLEPGEVLRVNYQAARDEIIMQQPEGSAVIQKGESVSLLVSDGPSPLKYIAPDLTGMALADAASVVKPMGVTIAATGTGRQVVAQDPKAGYPVVQGSQVSVTLGTKPAAPAPVPVAPAKAPTKAPAKPVTGKERKII